MKINKNFRAQHALILSLLFLLKRTIESIYNLFFSKLFFQLIAILVITGTNNLQAQSFDEVITYNICAGDTVLVQYAPIPPSILVYPDDCGPQEGFNCSCIERGPQGGYNSNLPIGYRCDYGKHRITGNEDWICEDQSLCFVPQASTEYEIYFPNDGCCFFDYRVKVIINIECSAYDSPLVDQYPWLNEIIDDNPCKLSSIEIYEDNNEQYFLIDLGFGKILLNNQGERACKEYADLSCLEQLNLTNIVDSWNCDSVSPGITGCTNSNAYNYNPEATVDDDSCIFPDLTYKMCEGNQVEIGPFSKLASPPGNCILDDVDFVRNIIPSDGLISRSDDYFIVAPTETTVYTIITSPPPVGPGYGEYCNLPNSITETVVVEVENCQHTDYFEEETTICSGDVALLSGFRIPPLGPDYYGQIIPFCTEVGYTIEPNIGIVSDNYDRFEVAPTETTTYTVSIEYVQLDSNSVCLPSYTYIEFITVFVEECEECEPGSSPDCPSPFEDYTICKGESIETTPFPRPYDAIDSPELPACTMLMGNISPLDGVISQVSDNYISYILSPEFTTTYIFSTYYGQSSTSTNCNPGETYHTSFTVFVEDDCDKTICKGDNIPIGPFPDPPIGAQGLPGTTPCSQISRTITPTEGLIQERGAYYILAPETTTTYTIESWRGPIAPGDACTSSETITQTVTIQVEQCGIEICAGETTTLSDFIDPPDGPQGPDDTYPCNNIVRSISPNTGVVSNNGDSFEVAPAETTTYTITSQRAPLGPGSECIPGLEFTESFIVFVEECEECEPGSSPDCPYPFEDYTICEGSSVETIIFPQPAFAVDAPGGILACTTLIGDISPQDGVVSKILDDDHIKYILAPDTTTTYTFTTYYGSSASSPNCNPGETFSLSFTVYVEECVPGSTPDNPYVIETCPGEQLWLSGSNADVPPPPITVIGDVGGPDFRYVDYSIDGPDGNVCEDCYDVLVSPQTTTLYTITWENRVSDLPLDRRSGTGYVLVEVQDCSTEVDLIAPNESLDVKFHVTPTELFREGELDIKVDFYNNGPGYVESVDFIWEINGVVEDITSYNGASVLAGNNVRAILPNYFFEAETDYTIKVTATNINDGVDINPQDNVYEFFLPAFEAAPDLIIEITEPVNPILGSGDIVVDISNAGNAYAYNFVINWSINGDLQTPLTVNNAPWNLSSPNSGSLSYKIGSRGFNPNNNYEIIAWIEPLGGEEDVDLTNNEATFYYIADDRAYYSADEVITICEGETITIGTSNFNYRAGCWVCYSTPTNPIWYLNNETIGTNNEITISPTESGLYYFYSDATTDCEDLFCGPGLDGADPYKADFVERDYGIIVKPCDDNTLLGCIDTCAPNYNPNATVDDGSCAAYDTCPDDTCLSKYTWNAEACICTEAILEFKDDCDDNNECTDDYMDFDTCECVNEPIVNCNNLCNNKPGLMQTASSFVCGGTTIYIQEILSVVNENSVKAYVLHEEKSFNGVDYILMQADNRFDNPGQNYNNRPLYVSAVIGTPGVDGYPKLDDDCTVWTPEGAYVVFLDRIILTKENERCESGQYFVDVSVKGGAGGISLNYAYTFIKDANRVYTDVSAGQTKTFGPYEDNGNYLIKVKDAKGCSLDYIGAYDCDGLYKVFTPSRENGSHFIAHSNPRVEIKSVKAYSLNGQIVKSNASINGSSCSVEILSNKGIYLIELLLSNDKFDYIKVIK